MKATTRKHIRFLTYSAIIAALYAALTIVLFEFSSLAIQLRLSEALCILPAFTPAAIPGLTIGCFLAGIVGGGNIWDAVFGSLATCLAAAITYGLAHLPKRLPALYPLPAVLLNAIVLPPILYYAYGYTSFLGAASPLPVMALYALSVGIGQTLACYGIGLPLYGLLRRLNKNGHLFPEEHEASSSH